MHFLVKFFPEITIKSKPVRRRLVSQLHENVKLVLREIDPAVEVQQVTSRSHLGEYVYQGQPIAHEGDVGYTCSSAAGLCHSRFCGVYGFIETIGEMPNSSRRFETTELLEDLSPFVV